MEYCNICKPHPKPIYPGDTRYICSSCEDPTITIKGPYEITKNIGLIQYDMDDIVNGISKDPNKYSNNVMRIANNYYSIKSTIDVAQKKFAKDPKRMRKLEKFKKSWEASVKAKTEEDNRKAKILDNVKVIVQKFDYIIDFNDPAVKHITDTRFLNMEFTDELLTQLMVTSLENHMYYVLRRQPLDKLIDEQIPEEYRHVTKDMKEYNDYLQMHYKNDEHLQEAFNTLFESYKLQELQDGRQKQLTYYMDQLTKEPKLTKKLLQLTAYKSVFDDYVLNNNGSFVDTCNKMLEMAQPVIEKCHQLLCLKKDLANQDIHVTISLKNGDYIE